MRTQHFKTMRRIAAHILSIVMIISGLGAGFAAPGGAAADEAYAADESSSYLVLRTLVTTETSCSDGPIFRRWEPMNQWEGSEAQQWCVRYYNDQLAEYKEYIDGVKTNEGNAQYAEPEIKDFCGCDIDGTQGDKDKVFLLSAGEFIKYRDKIPALDFDVERAGLWWLRSPKAGSSRYAAYAYPDDTVKYIDGFWSLAFSYRPAFYLNESFFTWYYYDEYEDAYYYSDRRENRLWYKTTGRYAFSRTINEGTAHYVRMHYGDDVISYTILGKYEEEEESNVRDASEALTEGDHMYLGTAADGYSGVPYWRVTGLKDEDGDGTNDHALLMSEGLWTGDGADSGAKITFDYDIEQYPIEPEGHDWNATLAAQWCGGFYDSVFSDEDKAVIAGRDVSGDDTDLYGLTEDNKVFFLSKQELQEHLGTTADADDGQDANLIAYAKDGTSGSWWLRNYQGDNSALTVTGEGAMSWTKFGTECYVRPAVYIDLTNLKLLTGGIDKQGKVDFAPSWYGEVPGDYDEHQGDGGGENTKPEKEDPVTEKIEIKDGTMLSSNGTTVKVISAANGTAEYTKAPNRKSVTVPAYVKVDSKNLKIVSIAAGAFKKSKATTVTVKTRDLTKASVKNSLKGSKVKTIKVKAGSAKVNKKYVKKYKKIFTKKNAGRKVIVK